VSFPFHGSCTRLEIIVVSLDEGHEWKCRQNINTTFLYSLGNKEWEYWVIIWHLILFEDV